MKIKRLILKTRFLEEQTGFYRNTLGMKVMESSRNHTEFQFGNTKVGFVGSADATPYHFAINIPFNKVFDALMWLRARTEILMDGDTELIDFKSWNAKSIYFYDRNQNVVELIGRKNLGIESEDAFSPGQFLGISEIGMPVENIEKTWQRLNGIRPLPIFDGNFDNFCAMGDEQGLFIVVNKQRKTWYPTHDPVFPSPFVMEGDYHFEFIGGDIKV